jgi:hypothetical protein
MASDSCSVPLINYSQNVGTVFAIGDTTVNATATDAAGNSATCSFTVHVKGASEQLGDLISKVSAVVGAKSPNGMAFLAKLSAITAALSTNDRLTASACMQAFINLVQAQEGKKSISTTVGEDLIADAVRIRAVMGYPLARM